MHHKHTDANIHPRGKMNLDIIKRITSEKKIILPSLKNQDCRMVKSQTKKVKDLLTNIPTDDITELNDLIYAGAKFPRRSLTESQNPGGNSDYNHR